MDILGLSTSPSSGGAYALILNETDGKRRLPIIIGTFEAQAIALELEHIKPPRPMTHDLMKSIITTFNAEFSQVFINELSEGTFFAKILYNRNGEQLEQDARPSDAIALAVRFSAPIYVEESILNEAGIITESEEQEGEATPAAGGEETSPEMSRLEQLERELQTAIETENYEKAARIRDEIQKRKG